MRSTERVCVRLAIEGWWRWDPAEDTRGDTRAARGLETLLVWGAVVFVLLNAIVGSGTSLMQRLQNQRHAISVADASLLSGYLARGKWWLVVRALG